MMVAVGLGCAKNESVGRPDASRESTKPSLAGDDAGKVDAARATGKTSERRAAIGEPAPEFTLTSLDGERVSLSQHAGKLVVLEWFNPDCPFVKQAHISGSLKGLGEQYADKDVVWLAINSNAEGKQGSSDEANRDGVKRFEIAYPVLMDRDGRVGRLYSAERTPHMYVIDKTGKLVYSGALDNTRGGDAEDVASLINYVTAAIADVQNNRPVSIPTSKAWGCTVKYESAPAAGR